MEISLKDLISRAPDKSSGIFSLNKNSILKIVGIDGNKASQYKDLQEFSLSDKEKEFTQNKWNEIKKENENYYDGDIIVVADIIYDDEKNQLKLIAQRAKYSTKLALDDPNYPNKERAKEFISFGIGVMGNLIVGSKNQMLMVERSQEVYSEKGAISVPGGEVEYNIKEGKDNVRDGLPKAVEGELIEEVLSEIHNETKFETTPTSISFTKNNNKAGLDVFFQIVPINPTPQITPESLRETFKSSADGKFEGTGVFFFFDPSKNFDSKSEDSPVRIVNSGKLKEPGTFSITSMKELVNSEKLEESGTFAIASQVYWDMKESYEKGKYVGLPPHPGGIANAFKLAGFSIFDMKSFKLTIPKFLTPKTEVIEQRVTHLKSQSGEIERN